ncbi:hypothetical protein [Paenibacillus sp. UNC451MF]|uniref:hypothetical protein n=1 Tax=Paenibacillus sp. UNC451MF TaxID=1449063 RepID=UPI000490E8DF|nr:hypothetical protein [Paenibacillus sp. UNC451MF]
MGKSTKAKNGADGQPGKNGTNATVGNDGQNAVSFTGLDETSLGVLLDQLKTVPGGNSIDVTNNNEKLQITLNGKTIVNINKLELTDKLKKTDDTQNS